jgi:hypothetical protein
MGADGSSAAGIWSIVGDVLAELGTDFEAMYAPGLRRPSVPLVRGARDR